MSVSRYPAVVKAALGVPALISASSTAAQNSAAIQAAITTAGLLGAAVVLPGGLYDHQGITLPASGKVALRGVGRGHTVLRNTHSTNASVTAFGTPGSPYCPEWELSGVTLTADARRTNQVGLDVQLSHLFSVRDVAISGHFYGVRHGSSWDCTYNTVNVSDCSTGWFFPTPPFTSSSPITVTNGSAWGCDTAVYIADGGECLTWTGGDFAASDFGVFVLGNATRAVSFTGVNFEGMASECVTIGDATTGPSAISFTACRFLKTGAPNVRAVRFIRGVGVSFTGCWFSGYTTAIRQEATAGDLRHTACSADDATVGTFLLDNNDIAREVTPPPAQSTARKHATVDQAITPPVDFSLVPLTLGGTTFNYGFVGVATANLLTAVQSGPHLVALSVKFSGGDAGPRIACVMVNGVSVREFGPGAGATDFTAVGSDILALAAGDTVGLSVYVGGSGAGPTVQGDFQKDTGISIGLLGSSG